MHKAGSSASILKTLEDDAIKPPASNSVSYNFTGDDIDFWVEKLKNQEYKAVLDFIDSNYSLCDLADKLEPNEKELIWQLYLFNPQQFMAKVLWNLTDLARLAGSPAYTYISPHDGKTRTLPEVIGICAQSHRHELMTAVLSNRDIFMKIMNNSTTKEPRPAVSLKLAQEENFPEYQAEFAAAYQRFFAVANLTNTPETAAVKFGP